MAGSGGDMHAGRDLQRGLLDDAQAPSGAGRLASDSSARAGSGPRHAPPPVEHIEQRGVSAAFLEHLLTAEITEAMQRKATADAVEFLKTKIAEVEVEIAQERARAASSLQPELELELEPEPEPEHGLGWYVSWQMPAAEHSERNALAVLERNLRYLQKDLSRREARSYLTSRDVHKLLVVAKTKDSMCRYVELSDVHGGTDAAGVAWVGVAQYFFSYSWDSPFESVVSALQTHSNRHVLAGKPPPYYWVDIFAVNQHLAMPPWRCESGLSDCPGCAAVAADMHDWATADPDNLKGFERVIDKTRHTLVLNEPWDSPRPPTRVWCLFEAYQTLARGGELEVVLDKAAQHELQLSFSERFGMLQDIVGGIDARLADATVAEDRDNIFDAIARLPGGFDDLNHEMRKSQQRWLCAGLEAPAPPYTCHTWRSSSAPCAPRAPGRGHATGRGRRRRTQSRCA